MGLSALAAKALGPHPLVLSLPSSLSAIGCVACAYLLGRRWLGSHGGGFAAGLILATSPFFIRNSALLRLDAPLTLAVAGAIVLIEAGRERPALLPWAWAAMALGALAKGLPAFLPLAIYLAAAPLLRSLHPWNRRAFWQGLPLLPLLAAPWYLFMAVGEPGFLSQHFGAEQTARLASPLSGEGLWRFLRDCPGELLRYHWLWLPLLAIGVGLAIFAGPRIASETRRGLRLALSWCLALLVACAFVREPVHRYLLPSYPAMAVLAAWPLQRWIPADAAERWRGPAARAAALGLVLLSVALAVVPGLRFSQPRYPEGALIRRWHELHPRVPMVVQAGACAELTVPFLHVNARVRTAKLELAQIEALRRRGAVALILDSASPIEATALSALRPSPVVQGRRFSLHLAAADPAAPSAPAAGH
jgi:4-amino-4-deoxy-L-arabinose transferase-like glycosyltransferase